MILKQIGFEELELYNEIEMLKTFSHYRKYKGIVEYETVHCEEQCLDFAKDESMEIWNQIMNHDTCGIFVIEEDSKYIAGCVVVTNSEEVHMLRNDMSNAVLWGYQSRF